MDILIKNMELPKEMECVEILLFHNGHCSFRKHERDEWVEAWAVALPSHGDLVEISKVKEAQRIHGQASPWDSYVPTIVEANNE